MFISISRKSITGNVSAKDSKEALRIIEEHISKHGFNLESIYYLSITEDPNSVSVEPSFDFEVRA